MFKSEKNRVKFLVRMVVIMFLFSILYIPTTHNIKAAEMPEVNLVKSIVPDVKIVSGDKNQEAIEQGQMSRLTDGILGDGDWVNHGDRYVVFYRNIGRYINILLNELSTIYTIKVRVLEDIEAGITVPPVVNFYLSDDGGKTWSYVGKVEKENAQLSGDGKHYVYEIKLPKYKADAIRVNFDVDVFIFMDEIEVFGTKGLTEDAQKLAYVAYNPYPEVNMYPVPGSKEVFGTKNDYLVYVGYHTEGTVRHDKSLDDFLPAVAYISKDGVIRDWIFDSFTFGPYQTSSRNKWYIPKHMITPQEAATKEDWEEFIDVLYTPNYQLEALNKAVEIAKGALHEKKYKAKVKINIPFPIKEQSNFGIIDGERLNFNQDEVGYEKALENRFKAVKWFVDEVMKRWDKKKFSNLELVGFYWQMENIDSKEQKLEEELIKKVSDYIHQRGKMIYWIPYYQANGLYKWKELGFDYAVMQPNYSFHDVGPERLEMAADIARRFGLGIEMELHWALQDPQYRWRFEQYMEYGIKKGYMTDSVKAWYLGTSSLQEAFESKDPEIRAIYDKIYAFIKGTYPNMPVFKETDKVPMDKELRKKFERAKQQFDLTFEKIYKKVETNPAKQTILMEIKKSIEAEIDKTEKLLSYLDEKRYFFTNLQDYYKAKNVLYESIIEELKLKQKVVEELGK
ncbi:DUF4855 domain-containing protein [Caldanaerobacter subterraneus KAk]|uniref:DUF4855 domain-containing protein n=1 Tax=Caldanaerobacter subterraneus TaxID=911092 RepID=UPI0032C0C121